MEYTNIEGTIVSFKAVNNYFAVLQVKTDKHEKPIRIVGKPPRSLQKGMNISANGKWEDSEKYGPQFQASTIAETGEAEKVTGSIEEIIHYTPRTRYGIIRIRTEQPKQGELITAVGEMTFPFTGNQVIITGQWETNKYGPQLQIKTIDSFPQTRHAILATLDHYQISNQDALILYSEFGSNTIKILKYQAETVLSLTKKGIELEKLQNIYNAWSYQERRESIAQELSLYQLQQYAVQIMSQFTHMTLEIIEREPYRLMEVDGIGFKTADRVAEQVGINKRDPARLSAALIHTLSQMTSNGHSCAPYRHVVEQCQKMIGQSRESIEAALNKAILSGKICLDKHFNGSENIIMVYLPQYFELEEETAQILRFNQQSPSRFTNQGNSINWNEFLENLSAENSVELTDEQQGAVVNGIKHKISILTGGPGTGKTTTLRMVINALFYMGAHVTLASPTGKAAKRLSESSGREAKTIHRILGWNQDTEEFQFNAENPLETEAIVIDEASMIDLPLFHSLIKALRPQTHIILVGDIYQLPSVGAGNVLRDLLESGRIPVTQLTKIFRQAETSKIVVNAYRINRGETLEIGKDSQDFFFFKIAENEIPKMVADIITKRLEKVYGPFNPNTDVQVLAPMKKGSCGIYQLNQILQDAINPASPDKPSIKRGQQREFRKGDKVIQLRNNYEKEVYNGDQGIVQSIHQQEQVLRVQIDDRIIDYAFAELYDQLMHAYCISTHRSQGSEYPVVIMPVSMEHGIMLQRNLLYTGVTRARKMIILVGSQQAIDKSIETTSNTDRFSGLKHQIQRV